MTTEIKTFADVANAIYVAEGKVARARKSQVETLALAIVETQGMVAAQSLDLNGSDAWKEQVLPHMNQLWRKAGLADTTKDKKAKEYAKFFRVLWDQPEVIAMCADYANLDDLWKGVGKPVAREEAPLSAAAFYQVKEEQAQEKLAASDQGRREGTTATPVGSAERIRKMISPTFDAGQREALADGLNFIFENDAALALLARAVETICNDFDE